MFSNTYRRAGNAALALVGLTFLAAAPARADSAAESYVATNAGQAINALGAAGTSAERAAKFGAMMEEFSDMPAITDFVLGPYARGLRTNPALKAQWSSAFRDYAMATYQDQLDRYRGSALKVTGSRDSTKNDQECSRVGTEMTQKNQQPLQIYWYLCRPLAGGTYKVADVGLVLGDSEVKLAITQRDQFVAFLGSNGGDISKLMARVKTQTAAMRAHIDSKKAAKPG